MATMSLSATGIEELAKSGRLVESARYPAVDHVGDRRNAKQDCRDRPRVAERCCKNRSPQQESPRCETASIDGEIEFQGGSLLFAVQMQVIVYRFGQAATNTAHFGQIVDAGGNDTLQPAELPQ